MNGDENQAQARKMKFLFCLGNGKTATKSFCGCSLKLGVQIICILDIILRVGVVVATASTGDAVVYAFLAGIIPDLIVLISTFNNNYKIAYFGTELYQICMYITLVSGILTIILLLTIVTYYPEINIMILFIVILTFSELYFSYIIFSFTKNLGLGNTHTLIGLSHPNSANEDNSIYIPPSNI